MLLELFKSKKKKVKDKFRFFFTKDVHAHLIPRVDDGPKTMEEAIALISGFQNLGLTSITATPHVYYQYYPNEKADLLDAFIKLKNAVVKQGLSIEINLAAEYFLDDHFEKLLEEDELLPLADNHLLVEIPFVAPPPEMYKFFFQIQTKGYKPLLAHPERYLYLESEDYEHLINAGCQFQANLLSFAGYYGKEVEKRAFTLLDKGWLHAIGSDVHNQHQLFALEALLVDPKLSKLKQRHWLNEFL